MLKSANRAIEGKSVFTLGLGRFLAWWASELATMVPVRLRHWWHEADRVLFLTFDSTDHAVVERLTITGRETLLSLDLTDGNPTARSASLSEDLSRRMNGNFRILLCLPKEKGLHRIVTLPLPAEENLRQTLGFEIDRYTPFKLDQVYFDYRIVDRNAVRRKLDVELVVARKALVDQELARAALLGLKVSGVVPAHAMVLPRPSINLLPAAALGSSHRQVPWSRLALAGIAGLLLVALLGIPIWQKHATANSLLQPLQEARTSATEADRLRDRLDKLVAEHNLLPDKKWQEFSSLMVLSELSKLLPDDSFVSVLEYDGKTVQIQGESASAASLVETIDASPLFKDVSFKAQVTKIQGTSNDRFHLGATLDAGARPTRTAPAATSGPAISQAEAEQ
jgi:general secretion pathway protein L